MRIGISMNVDTDVLGIFGFIQKEVLAQLEIATESILVKI